MSCNCLKEDREVMNTKNHRIVLGQIVKVVDLQETVLGIGIVDYAERGLIKAVQFVFCPICGERWIHDPTT